MKCKYKKFLKAAYINYEEDYCSNAVLRKTRPPLEEILAPATFEVTANHVNGYYWATFYTSMANYQAPDGVRVYKVNLNGSQFTWINIEDGIINKRQGVILRSSTSSITLTKTYSKSSDDYSNNSLIGTDYLITNPGNAYVLNYKQSHGLSFYHLSDTGRIKANAAYLVIPIIYLTQWKIVGNSEVHTLPYPDGVVLPNGYKRCEYLTFDGNSYINTGIKTANDIGYDLKCKSVPVKVLIGGRNNADSDGFVVGFFQTNKVAVAYGGVTNAFFPTTGNYNDNSVHHIILDSVKFQIDDEILGISSLRGTADIFLDIYLGTWNNNGTPDSRMWSSNIYDTIIYNTQGEIWHGIPCLDANGVPCFYDIISHTAFYNQGSGSFTYKLYPQPTEIWSCGEYNPIDGKYHILVQPLGGSIADIALNEPLRKVNNVADTIEFPSDTEGKALVTRNFASADLGNFDWNGRSTTDGYEKKRYSTSINMEVLPNCIGSKVKESVATALCSKYNIISPFSTYNKVDGIGIFDSSIVTDGQIFIYDSNADTLSTTNFKNYIQGVELIYQITPTTELVDAPQIEEADSYSMVISQGAKAVEWSSFETE